MNFLLQSYFSFIYILFLPCYCPMPITYYKIQIQVFKTPYLHFSVIEDLEGGDYDRDLSLLPV